jgi:RNA polymerase sigma-70 factor (ECF subfamily)
MIEDEHAIRHVLVGEREAFRSLVVRHQAAVRATIHALWRHCPDWEDVAQDVFLAAFRHLATFEAGKGSFRTWLLAITRNQCRTARKRPTATQVDALPDGADYRTPDVAACEEEWFRRLDDALAALPEDQRLLFVLVEMQGLSYQEAAEVADINLGTVKSRLSRAKEWLRETLAPLKTEHDRAAAGAQDTAKREGR